MATDKTYDMVIFGASGFTGRLVADYLARRVADGEAVRWAMAGRDLAKLAAVRDEMGLSADTPLIGADADNPASLDALMAETALVITTVGPYQLYGEPLVAACAEAGVDYVDLCGEPAWMRQMVDAYGDKAKASGARIVFSCGFDSVPFDMGVWMLQQAAQQKLGAPLPRISARVRKMKGTFSGGTAASLGATLAAAKTDPVIAGYLRSPFALTPGFEGPRQPSMTKPREDELSGGWVAPFIMAPINTKNVHRSNFLLGHPYGEDFEYDEMFVTGPGDKGKAVAEAIASDTSMTDENRPKPGEGPSAEARAAGHYDVLFIGTAADGTQHRLVVTGDMDPGYGSTSKILTECALSLSAEAAGAAGGILTPAAIFGQPLIDRLSRHAGLSFTLETS